MRLSFRSGERSWAVATSSSTLPVGLKGEQLADLAAMNVNLVGGDPYGGACSIDQFFIWRPFPQSVNGTSLVLVSE